MEPQSPKDDSKQTILLASRVLGGLSMILLTIPGMIILVTIFRIRSNDRMILVASAGLVPGAFLLTCSILVLRRNSWAVLAAGVTLVLAKVFSRFIVGTCFLGILVAIVELSVPTFAICVLIASLFEIAARVCSGTDDLLIEAEAAIARQPSASPRGFTPLLNDPLPARLEPVLLTQKHEQEDSVATTDMAMQYKALSINTPNPESNTSPRSPE